MKHLFLTSLIQIIFIVFSSVHVYAYDACINGVCYNLVNKAHIATVVEGTTKYSGDIIIPKTVVYNNEEYIVTDIDAMAFYLCKQLSSITIPETIKKIGGYAFYGCKSLKKVNITDLAAWCNIEFVDYNSNPVFFSGNLSLNGELIKDLVIPTSVTKIGKNAFVGMTSLSSVSISPSVKEVGYNAFFDCPSLKTIYIQDLASWCKIVWDNSFNYSHNIYLNGKKITNLIIPDTLSELTKSAFYGCTSIISVIIPNSINSIPSDAFMNCSSLQSITIPKSVTNIGSYSFYGCGLTTINFPNTIKNISQSCFACCKELTSVSIPNSVTNISEYAFWECKKLKKIDIGKSVRKIDKSAFADCEELTSVQCNAVIPPSVDKDGFRGSLIEYVTLYVPSESLDQYKVANVWKDFGKVLPISDNTGIIDIESSNIICNTNCGIVTISGLASDENVSFYNANGTLLSSMKAVSGSVMFHAESENIIFVKIGKICRKIYVK